MDYAEKIRITEAMRYFAVAIHEMTNGAHQLGRIKILQTQVIAENGVWL